MERLNIILLVILTLSIIVANGLALELSAIEWAVYVAIVSGTPILIQAVVHIACLILDMYRYWRKTRGR